MCHQDELGVWESGLWSVGGHSLSIMSYPISKNTVTSVFSGLPTDNYHLQCISVGGMMVLYMYLVPGLEWALNTSFSFQRAYHILGMGNISILSYIVILRAHNNHIVVVLQLLSCCLHIISGGLHKIRHTLPEI